MLLSVPRDPRHGKPAPIRRGNGTARRRYRARVSTPPNAPRSSAFAAAAFSALLPGLGQAYQRRWRAALIAAAPLVLVAALVGGIVVADGLTGLLGALISPLGLSVAGSLNIAALAWRAACAADAWRFALQRGSGLRPTSASALGALLAVAIGSGLHLLAGSYIGTASALVGGIFGPSGDGGPSPSGGPVRWDGTERLNVLLVGIDRRGSGANFNTDTMIVASIDPAKGSVTMFSIPRDTVDVPVPSRARSLYGATFSGKINAYYASARRHPETFPDGPMPALRELLGQLYGIQIDYSLMVDFAGFEKIIDTLGGVRLVARNPIVDESYPLGGRQARIRIQAGVHGMDGAQALIFARSRHGSSDFDRAARQQQVIAAVRSQADIGAITGNIAGLATELKDALKSEFPQDDLPKLLELISRVDVASLRTVVFSPPYYQTEGRDERGYIITPDVAKIRAGVIAAFAAEPTAAELEGAAIEREAARVWVLNGTGRPGEAGTFAAALTQKGAPAIVPQGTSAPEIGLLQTRFVVYNGAETRIPATLALLERLLGRQAVRIDDPAASADVLIVTGADLPTLAP